MSFGDSSAFFCSCPSFALQFCFLSAVFSCLAILLGLLYSVL